MKFLLFLVGISYFFIFFFLNNKWEESDIVPLFLQAQMYIFWALLLILYTLEMKSFHPEQKSKILKFQLSPSTFLVFIKKILKENLYPFWIFLLYCSLYFILHWLFENLYISHMFAVINIGVICLYFVSHKSQLFYDIVKWNTIISSLFYSWTHILLLFGFSDTQFLLSDYINMGAISILFILLFSSVRSKENAWIFASHALVFFLLEFCILFYFIVPSEFFIISIIFLLSALVHLFFYWIDLLEKKTYIPSVFFLRTWNILSCILIFLWGLVLFWDMSVWYLWAFALLLLHAYYLCVYYKNFWNIWSLFFWFLGVFLGISAWIINLYGTQYYILQSTFILLWVSLFTFTLPVLRRYIPHKDLYIIHLLFLSVNMLWVLLFLFLRDFSILHFWFLLLFEAGYFIANSYLFKKLYLPWNDL